MSAPLSVATGATVIRAAPSLVRNALIADCQLSPCMTGWAAFSAPSCTWSCFTHMLVGPAAIDALPATQRMSRSVVAW